MFKIGLTWGRTKSSFLLFLTKGSVSYHMLFTGSKNIVPSQSYQILKSGKYGSLQYAREL